MNRLEYIYGKPQPTSIYKGSLHWKRHDHGSCYKALVLGEQMFILLNGKKGNKWDVLLVAEAYKKERAVLKRMDGFRSLEDAKEYCGDMLQEFFEPAKRFMR